MSWEWVHRAEAPWIRLSGSEVGTLYDALKHESRRRGMALRVLRGAHMRTEEALMDEFAAACQLPPYFGRNWDALDECLQDLDISGTEGVLIAILDADQLLADAPPEDGRVFFDLLQIAGQAHAHRSHPRSFHLILQAEPRQLPTLEEGLLALGVATARI